MKSSGHRLQGSQIFFKEIEREELFEISAQCCDARKGNEKNIPGQQAKRNVYFQSYIDSRSMACGNSVGR